MNCLPIHKAYFENDALQRDTFRHNIGNKIFKRVTLMIYKASLMAFTFTLSLVLSGCATLFGDKDKSVRIESNPSGAKVYLNGAPYGKTPTTIQLQSLLSSNSVRLKLDGYDEVTRPIHTSIQPIAFLNILNLVCWGIDLATGNVMKVDTKVLSVDLDKKTVSVSDGLNVKVVSISEFNQCISES